MIGAALQGNRFFFISYFTEDHKRYVRVVIDTCIQEVEVQLSNESRCISASDMWYPTAHNPACSHRARTSLVLDKDVANGYRYTRNVGVLNFKAALL